MFYGIEALLNYGNECTTERSVDKGKSFLGRGCQSLFANKEDFPQLQCQRILMDKTYRIG